jgi:hypothetical protein
VATYNSLTGVEVWRSGDGGSWSQVNADGFGAVTNCSGPSMASHGGRLYVGTYGCGAWPPPCEVWRETAFVFANGFESGDASAWSAAVD